MTTIYRSVCYPRSSKWDSLNLDLDEKNILFHVSIRPDVKRLVVNDLVDGNWGTERVLAFDPADAELLPLTLLCGAGHIHLLLGGELRATVDVAWPAGRAVSVRASMPWTVSTAFGPFADTAACTAWLPPEGIGATSLNGFIAAPGWAGGPVAIAIGTSRFTAQAMPASAVGGMARGFVVPLDPAIRDALAQATAEQRQATPLSVDFGAAGRAEAWINPPGVVEKLHQGVITGWVRTRGATPRLELLANGTPVAAQAQLGGLPDFPGDALIATRREDADDGYAAERRIAFTLDLPAAIRAMVEAGQRVELRLLGDGAELIGGTLALGRDEPAAPSATAEGEPEEEQDAAQELGAVFSAAPVSTGEQGSVVEVLRMEVQPGSGKDVFLDLMAPDGDVALHVRYRAAENWLVTNHRSGGVWGKETVLGRLPSSWFRLAIDVEIGAGRCVIAVNHVPWGEVLGDRLGPEALSVRGPHQRFARRAARGAVPAAGRPAAGAVDRITRNAVLGWVADPKREAPLLLEFGEGPVALSPQWVELPALAARLGRDDALIGFVAPLPPALRGKVWSTTRGLALSLGDERLSLPRPWSSAVAEIDGFVLRGDVIGGNAGAAPHIGLLLAGKPLDVSVVCWQEPPLPPLRDAGVSLPRHGFEIELPGTIWCGLDPEAGAALDVTLDGRVLEPTRLLFTRAMARKALARAARIGDATPEAQCGALLAVEHLAFGGFLPGLPEEVAGFLRDVARRMKLEPFLRRGGAQAADAVPPPAAPMRAEDQQRITVWRALRAVTRRMATDIEPVFGHARLVEEEWQLAGAAQQHFWFALVPTLCATDELPLLAQAVPLSTWFHHEEKPDAWALSSAIALLAAGGEARRATDALYRLAGAIDGWINSACIGFALRHVEAEAATGRLAVEEAERFRYAFLALLDAFKGAWFSRLHDRHFVEGMVLLLGQRQRMPDYLAQDLLRAALRHYGLSPAFWQRWAAGPGRQEAAADALLAQAQRRFRQIEAAMATPEGVDAQLSPLHDALQFFRRRRNPEALYWQRELAAHALRPGSTADAGVLARLLAELAALAGEDAVRIAAMPGNPAPGGLDNLGVAPDGLRDMLRGMRPQPRGMAEQAQRALGHLLSGADDAASRARARDLAEALAAARFGHVGADMLSLLAAREQGGGAAGHALIERFGVELLRALEEVASPSLPAPLLAGMARLARLTALPQMPAVLRVMHAAIADRYENRHDEALAQAAAPVLPMEPTAIAGDVLVCVYSCNKYLDSRVAAIRETWMRDLAPLGARCIVIVGDGDDRLHGDVLRLAVSDAYEDLPQKTLRMVEWVHANTDAQYLIKIDDDCYLSAENFFGTLEYRAHHYHGRVLERPVGGTDRVWHHLKSSSERARGIDRSPEPSRYCDGGGVYSLSRHVMGRLLAAARRRDGQRLISRSFMEDKLVGDLLALEDIAPANTDYESYQRRRTFGAAHPVGIYENTFFPSALAPAKVAHLDLERDQARAHALRGTLELSPKKLWPSFATVGTDHKAHQLELLSSVEALARAQGERIGVVLAARNEMTMLPHLLDHYRTLGVRAFYAVDNLSDDGSREWLLSQPDVVVYSASGEYRTSHYGVTWQQTVLGHHFIGRWAVVADADEFLIYPGWRQRPLAELVAAVEAEGADAVPLRMVDFYPFGSLEDADFTARPPFEAAPWLDREPVHPSRLTTCFYSNRVQQVSALRHRLLPDSEPNSFVAEKVALFRYHPWLRVSEGLHSAANVRLSSRQRAVFAHFKYHAGFRRKILEEIARGQHFNGAIEYRRYAAMIAESFGAFGREGLSVQLGADGFLPEPSEKIDAGR